MAQTFPSHSGHHKFPLTGVTFASPFNLCHFYRSCEKKIVRANHTSGRSGSRFLFRISWRTRPGKNSLIRRSGVLYILFFFFMHRFFQGVRSSCKLDGNSWQEDFCFIFIVWIGLWGIFFFFSNPQRLQSRTVVLIEARLNVLQVEVLSYVLPREKIYVMSEWDFLLFCFSSGVISISLENGLHIWWSVFFGKIRVESTIPFCSTGSLMLCH